MSKIIGRNGETMGFCRNDVDNDVGRAKSTGLSHPCRPIGDAWHPRSGGGTVPFGPSSSSAAEVANFDPPTEHVPYDFAGVEREFCRCPPKTVRTCNRLDASWTWTKREFAPHFLTNGTSRVRRDNNCRSGKILRVGDI
jgi:hypothetical protein